MGKAGNKKVADSKAMAIRSSWRSEETVTLSVIDTGAARMCSEGFQAIR
jgi:hypothetical protein